MVAHDDYRKAFHAVFICDNNYVMPTLIAISSLKENSSPENIYIIHICTVGLSSENADTFKNLSSEKFKILIHDFAINDYLEKIRFIRQKSHVTPAALLKFDLPAIISEDVNTVLYLDSDVVIIKNIDELFMIDLENYYAAAVYDFWKFQMSLYNGTAEAATNNHKFYFNSGVVLFNLKKFREENISQILWSKKLKYANDPEQKSFLMDQDILNEVFSERCFHLPIKYNFNNAFINYKKVDFINNIYGTEYANSEAMKEDIKIIHYVGEQKPWKYFNVKCREEWEYYYQKSGHEINNLNRKKLRTGILNNIRKMLFMIKTKGIIGFLIYLFKKRSFFKGSAII